MGQGGRGGRANLSAEYLLSLLDRLPLIKSSTSNQIKYLLLCLHDCLFRKDITIKHPPGDAVHYQADVQTQQGEQRADTVCMRLGLILIDSYVVAGQS